MRIHALRRNDKKKVIHAYFEYHGGQFNPPVLIDSHANKAYIYMYKGIYTRIADSTRLEIGLHNVRIKEVTD